MDTYGLSAFVTIGICLFTFYLAFNVGMTRTKNKSKPWEKTENKDVMIANRAHLNTVENIVVFLPLLWIATIFGPTTFAGIVGIIRLFSRVAYAFSYLKAPKKREIPFIIGVACIAVTALLGMYGILF